jgi:hypothetical protein
LIDPFGRYDRTAANNNTNKALAGLPERDFFREIVGSVKPIRVGPIELLERKCHMAG